MPFKLRIYPGDSELIGSSLDHYRKFHNFPPKDFRKLAAKHVNFNFFQLIIFVFMFRKPFFSKFRHDRQENSEIMS